ncbi:toll/interleukin-1 receptor domain-containing protein [Winogradskyella sp.]|jgi:hypothetical protein|uniref:toll/interleukin-1 receptor domain-containing protein n=1 Tax=Winogradskyella sp. TaxID=1883156 RepID=UPI0025DF077D|nr:toll/interleukin-1 receptor domain-containing protein [Winogradskyella sp.]MCT4628821.1 toll/interleukin-1 receptor domain-containing protein [Winogradskyella sp.]
MSNNIPIFYSYSHKDEVFRKELEMHLTILKRQGIIETWYDRRIAPGNNWKEEINLNMQSAKIILLLISSNFLASDYCYDSETIFAMDQAKEEKTIVIPIILKPCLWKEGPFKELKALPRDGKPITTWENIDEAWLNVTEGILQTIKNIHESKTLLSQDSQKVKSLSNEIVKPGGGIQITLSNEILRFLKAYNKWYFSPLRIQKWGGKRDGFEKLREFDSYSIKSELEKLKNIGKVKSTLSQQGNTIYKLK